MSLPPVPARFRQIPDTLPAPPSDSPLTPAELDRVAEAVAAAKAPATRRAYRAAWNAWCAWSEARGTPPLPAGALGLAAFLTERAEDGRSMASIRQTLSAIGEAHKAAGWPAPAAHPGIAAVVAGLARQAAAAGRTTRQARPLDAEAVAAIRAALHARDNRARRPAHNWRAVRDMALIAVLADAGLRRGEAAALTWDDIAKDSDGGRVTVRRSKTDPEGAGAVVAITTATLHDLERWQHSEGPIGPPDSPVFGLSDRQIGRRVAALAREAGLGDGYSGHSGRVGLAQRMTRNGAPAAAVMRQGRWQSPEMMARYTRGLDAGEALRYL